MIEQNQKTFLMKNSSLKYRGVLNIKSIKFLIHRNNRSIQLNLVLKDHRP